MVPYVSRQTLTARSFSVMGQSTWNNLPTIIRSSTVLNFLRKILRHS